jgi:hypothetical protein
MIRTKYLELQKYAFSFVYALVVCNNDSTDNNGNVTLPYGIRCQLFIFFFHSLAIAV